MTKDNSTKLFSSIFKGPAYNFPLLEETKSLHHLSLIFIRSLPSKNGDNKNVLTKYDN